MMLLALLLFLPSVKAHAYVGYAFDGTCYENTTQIVEAFKVKFPILITDNAYNTVYHASFYDVAAVSFSAGKIFYTPYYTAIIGSGTRVAGAAQSIVITACDTVNLTSATLLSVPNLLNQLNLKVASEVVAIQTLQTKLDSEIAAVQAVQSQVQASSTSELVAFQALQDQIALIPGGGGGDVPASGVFGGYNLFADIANASGVQQASVFSHTQQEYVDAALIIFSTLLSAWVSMFAYRKVIAMLHWSRGDKE